MEMLQQSFQQYLQSRYFILSTSDIYFTVIFFQYILNDTKKFSVNQTLHFVFSKTQFCGCLS